MIRYNVFNPGGIRKEIQWQNLKKISVDACLIIPSPSKKSTQRKEHAHFDVVLVFANTKKNTKNGSYICIGNQVYKTTSLSKNRCRKRDFVLFEVYQFLLQC